MSAHARRPMRTLVISHEKFHRSIINTRITLLTGHHACECVHVQSKSSKVKGPTPLSPRVLAKWYLGMRLSGSSYHTCGTRRGSDMKLIFQKVGLKQDNSSIICDLISLSADLVNRAVVSPVVEPWCPHVALPLPPRRGLVIRHTGCKQSHRHTEMDRNESRGCGVLCNQASSDSRSGLNLS
jgi:hypothetical protein